MFGLQLERHKAAFRAGIDSNKPDGVPRPSAPERKRNGAVASCRFKDPLVETARELSHGTLKPASSKGGVSRLERQVCICVGYEPCQRVSKLLRS